MIANFFRHTVSLTVAAGATLLIVVSSAAPVSAATFSAEAVPTARVSLAGIDLTSTAGMARVTDEVRRTARRLCSTSADRSANAAQTRSKCIIAAVNGARPRLEALAAAQRDAREALAGVSAPNTPVLR